MGRDATGQAGLARMPTRPHLSGMEILLKLLVLAAYAGLCGALYLAMPVFAHEDPLGFGLMCLLLGGAIAAAQD